MRQKNLAVLRLLQILFALILIFEAITAAKLGLMNIKIMLNENLRSTPAQEIYIETYNSLASKKAELKQQNPVAALPIAGRIALYLSTISCFCVTTKIRNKIRKRRVYNAAPVTPVTPVVPTPTIAPVAHPKRKWVDMARYYNYPIQ